MRVCDGSSVRVDLIGGAAHYFSMGASATYLPKATVKTLSRRSDLWGAWLTAHVWGVIVAAWAMAILWTNPLTILLAILLVGSRQHGLSILMHDAAHGVLFKTKRLNDFVGIWLLGAPYGGDLRAYRKYHLKHHRHTQTEDDPDLPLSEKFPVSKASLRRKFIRDLTGQTFLRLRMAGFKASYEPGMEAFEKTSVWPYLITNLVLFAGLVGFGHWWVYPVLWLLPLATWFMAVLRNRNIAEHAITTRDGNVLTQARTTRTNWLSRIFLAPYWVNYHVEHHAYMFVPCWQLPRLHKALTPHHGDMEIQGGYTDVLKLAATG